VAVGEYENRHPGADGAAVSARPGRIDQDICDRLTDNPFIDASDIEVTVHGSEVFLTGSVDSAIALRQAEEIAAEVAGVGHVHNRLGIRSAAGERCAPSPGDQVNRAIGSDGTR
jgi:osmotically-inducible protein OsmY